MLVSTELVGFLNQTLIVYFGLFLRATACLLQEQTDRQTDGQQAECVQGGLLLLFLGAIDRTSARRHLTRTSFSLCQARGPRLNSVKRFVHARVKVGMFCQFVRATTRFTPDSCVVVQLLVRNLTHQSRQKSSIN